MPIAFHWLASLFFAIPAAAVAEPVKTSPEGAALSVDPAFSFPDAKKPEKMRSSLSDIACPSALDVPNRCSGFR